MGQIINNVGATSRARARAAGDHRRKKQFRLGAQIKTVIRPLMQTDVKTISASSRIESSQTPSIFASNKEGEDTWINVIKVVISAPDQD